MLCLFLIIYVVLYVVNSVVYFIYIYVVCHFGFGLFVLSGELLVLILLFWFKLVRGVFGVCMVGYLYFGFRSWGSRFAVLVVLD